MSTLKFVSKFILVPYEGETEFITSLSNVSL